jgi:ABC-type phosphate/phosphonate transport system substrate-binding protein
MKSRILLLAAAFALAACSASTKRSWQEGGHSWAEAGKQTARAIGESVDPDANDRKGEWKQVGEDFKEAGKDTGRAVSTTITPDK